MTKCKTHCTIFSLFSAFVNNHLDIDFRAVKYSILLILKLDFIQLKCKIFSFGNHYARLAVILVSVPVHTPISGSVWLRLRDGFSPAAGFLATSSPAANLPLQPNFSSVSHLRAQTKHQTTPKRTTTAAKIPKMYAVTPFRPPAVSAASRKG